MLKKEQKWDENAQGGLRNLQRGAKIFRVRGGDVIQKSRSARFFLILFKSFVPFWESFYSKSEKKFGSEKSRTPNEQILYPRLI